MSTFMWIQLLFSLGEEALTEFEQLWNKTHSSPSSTAPASGGQITAAHKALLGKVVGN